MASDLAQVSEATVWEGQSVLFEGYVETSDGEPLQAATVFGWDRYVYLEGGRGSDTAIASYTLVAQPGTALIHDTLQPWDEDDRGFNYSHGLSFEYTGLSGGNTYIIEILVDAGSYGLIPIVWRLKVRNLRSVDL